MTAKHAKQAEDAKSNAARGGARGHKPALHLGERLTRSGIAKRGHLDSVTVAKYLEMEGAPQPDERRRYDFKATIAWIEANAPRATANNLEMKSLREAKMRIEAEEAAFDFGIKKGRFIEREKLEPAIAAFCQQLTADMRAKFEFELPDKYEGKNAIERKVLNADGIDWVLKRLKTGAEELANKKP